MPGNFSKLLQQVPKLVLASKSPRRRQILETLGIDFLVDASETPEVHPDTDSVDETTIANARRKAETIAFRRNNPEEVLLSADTVVVLKNIVLGKPADEADVLSSLKRLSGRSHIVATGLVLHSAKYGTREACVKTTVHFRELSDAEMKAYASTSEPYDKAGSYAIQGLGSLFVDRIEGSYTNVVGLPLERTLTELAALTGIPLSAWFPR